MHSFFIGNRGSQSLHSEVRKSAFYRPGAGRAALFSLQTALEMYTPASVKHKETLQRFILFLFNSSRTL